MLWICLFCLIANSKAFLLPTNSSDNGAIFSREFETRLRSFINKSMECHHIPGMTLAVVKGDTVWTAGFGMEDLSTSKPVDADSKFNIGSVTKSFTATLLGILLQEKGLDWKAKVMDILGQGYEFTDLYRTNETTVRDMLSHRTGLARLDFGSACGVPRTVSRSTFCKHLRYLPEEFPIRDRFLYNNYMYVMLGHVTEVLGGQFYERLMRSKIFQPIGLNDSSFLLIPEDVLGRNIAKPYIYRDGRYQNSTLEIYELSMVTISAFGVICMIKDSNTVVVEKLNSEKAFGLGQFSSISLHGAYVVKSAPLRVFILHPIGSDGGLMMSANDMAKWVKFNLNMGKTDSGRQLIDKERMEEMFRSAVVVNSEYDLYRPEFPVHDVTKGYGYAWFNGVYRGFKKIAHGGSLTSYQTQLWMFPDKNLGIFASVNGPGIIPLAAEHLSAVLYYMVDHLLGLEPWLNETTACTFPEPWRNWTMPAVEPETPINIDNITDYEGSYGNHMFPDVIITTINTTLHLDSNKIHGILHPSSEMDRFLFEITAPWEYATNTTDIPPMNVTFSRDAKTGNVTDLTIRLEVDLTYSKGVSVLDIDK